MRHVQRNITLSPEQRLYVDEHFGKMDLGKISAALGIGYQKLHKNLRVMGKVKTKAKVIRMDGCFDSENFLNKYYKY